jgi:hypothetical protein
MGLKYETLGEGTWVIHDEYEQIDNIVVRHEAPILLCRVKLMDLPTKGADLMGLYRMLLELNAREMLGAAYGIDGNAIVATETLQSENLDYNEFQAAIDGLSLCISDHYARLSRFRPAPEASGARGSP